MKWKQTLFETCTQTRVHTIKTYQTSSPVHDGTKPFTCSCSFMKSFRFANFHRRKCNSSWSAKWQEILPGVSNFEKASNETDLSSVTDADISRPKMFNAKRISETLLNSSNSTWSVVNKQDQWSMKKGFLGVGTWKSILKQFMKELSHSSATCALKVFQWEIVWLNTWNQLIKLHMNLSNVLYANLDL